MNSPSWMIGVLLLAVATNAYSHEVSDGFQVMTLPDASVYEGNVRAGLLNGQGTLRFPNGDVFAGVFKNGLMHGVGTLTATNGDVFHGVFEGHDLSGEGVITYADGAVYEGEWKDWYSHGHGTYTLGGTSYIGSFENGTPAGSFEIHFADGSTYRGGYRGWAYHGEGTYTSADGTVYEGTFDNHELTGPATVTSPNGATYTGGVSYWQYQGEGELKRANGDAYRGSFEFGKYDGFGVLTTHDGTRYEGNFAYGEFHGHGTLTSPDQHITGKWQRGFYIGDDAARFVRTGLSKLDVETVMYSQPELIDMALSQVRSGVPGKTEVFSVGVAPYASQDVFMQEAEFFRESISEHFRNHASNVLLINNQRTVLDVPLATTTNFKLVVQGFAQRMNVEEDLLFLYLTSHGAEEGELSTNFPGVELQGLSPTEVRETLDDAGVKWRILVISACYSGNFVSTLASSHSLVMTSARSDRMSFGCSDDAELTYFGQAFLRDALPDSNSMESAFFAARKLIRTREAKSSYVASEPQIHLGDAMRAKLESIEAVNQHSP